MAVQHHRTPRDLAHVVATRLGAQKGLPTVDELEHLLDVCFLASLKFEEGRQIRCVLTFASLFNPDPDPPQLIRMDRWVYVALGTQIPLTPASLAKVAFASDPRTSALAIRCRNGKPTVHGMFDQQGPHHDMLLFERTGGYGAPGAFQIHIAGPGHLKVMQDWTVVGELHDGILSPRTQDALREGPVVEYFTEAIDAHVRKLVAEARRHRKELDAEQIVTEAQEWIQTLRRLLVRAQAHGRGACFTFLKSPIGIDLKPRYRLEYGHLRAAIEARSVARIQQLVPDSELQRLLDSGTEVIPALLYLDQSVASADAEDADEAITGAIEFIATLSRIDGAVVLTDSLDVLGFGAEIIVPDTKGKVSIARTGRPRGKTSVDFSRYGTRHRSAMRYCGVHHDALALVVSEDGPVRAIRYSRGRLWFWDNLQLWDVRDWSPPNMPLQLTAVRRRQSKGGRRS
jgi:Probable sensor domain DACNV